MHFLKSLVFPIFSPSFYAQSVKKGAGKAWFVFFLFTILTTIASFLFFTLDFGLELLRLPEEMDNFPEIRIENGMLSVQGADMPIEFTDNGSCFMLDTRDTAIDTEIPSICKDAVFMKKYSVTVRSKDNPQDIDISYDEILTQMERDSIVLDEEIFSSFIQTFGVIIILISPIFIFLGQIIGRLFMVLLVTILGFIAFSVMKEPNGFNKSFIITMYAVIPVVYINTISGLIGRGIYSIFAFRLSLGDVCCLIPLFISLIKWGIFWAIGAYGVRKMNQ